MNVYEFLAKAALEDKGIVFCSKNLEEEISYKDLWQKVLKLAHYYQQQGFKENQVVILVLPNDINFVLSFFALQVIGAIPCAVYPPLRFKKLNEWKRVFEHQVKTTKAIAVIGDERLRPLLENNNITRFISPEEFVFEMALKQKDFKRGDFAFFQFSSGTTGLPKAIPITHEMVVANVSTIRASFPDPVDGRGHRTISWLPLYHDMGLVGAMLTSVYAKVKLVLMRPEDFLVNPMSWPKKISEHQGTVTVAPNFAFGLCVKRFREMDLDLSHLEVAMCGAEQVHQDTMELFFYKFSPYGLKAEAITPVYGMAEATLAISFSDLTKKPVYTSFDLTSLIQDKKVVLGEGLILASLGRPLPGTEIEIRTEFEQDLGEIWVRGPGIYQKETWINTGDQGFLFEGELYLWGRIKDILIVNGKNIDPTYLELACRNIDSIRPGKVVAVHDYRSSIHEKIIVFAEALTKNKEELKSQIVTSILNETGIKIHEVIILEPGDLPRTSSGKIQRSKCLEYYYSASFGKVDRNKIDMTKLLVHSAKLKTKEVLKRGK